MDPQTEEVEDEESELARVARLALGARTDLRALEQLEAQTSRQFQARRYLRAYRSARESLEQMEETAAQYRERTWVLALTAAARILATSKATTKAAREARQLQEEAEAALRDGSFREEAEVLARLGSALEDLHAYEMDRSRRHVAAQGRALGEIQAMGGDTTHARRALEAAAVALAQDDRERYLTVVDEVDGRVERAREARIEALRDAARGAPPPLRQALEEALEYGDFVSAHLLLEAGVPPSSHLEPDDNRVVLVEKMIGQVWPVVEEGRAQGHDVEPAVADLEAAVKAITEGRYALALRLARKAYQRVKGVRPEPPRKASWRKRKEPKEGEPAQEEEKRGPEGPLLWCFRCGSLNVETGENHRLRCRECQAEFALEGPAP